MSLVIPPPAGSPHKSRTLADLTLSAIFATSYFVVFEPAPFDILFTAFVVVSLVLSQPKVNSTSLAVLLLVGAFTATRTFTLLLTDDLDSSLRFFGITTYLSATAWIFSVLIAKRGVVMADIAMNGLYVGTVITAIAVFVSLLHVGPIQDLVLAYGRTRAKGFFKDPNVMSPALIPVVLYSMMKLTSKFSKIHFVMLLISVSLVIVSFSRGAIATLIGAGAIFLLLLAKLDGAKAARRLILKFILGAIVAGAALLPVYMHDSSTFSGGGGRSTSYDEDRFYVHRRLLEEVSITPWGIGPGATNQFIRSNFSSEKSNAAHHTYLRVAIENGWTGIALYLLIVLYTLYLGIRTYFRGGNEARYAALFVSAYAATLVSALTVDTLHWRHQWWISAFIWGLAAWRGPRVSISAIRKYG